MDNKPIPQIIDPSWHEHLQPLFNDPKMELIKNSLLPSERFFPERKDIFRVFKMPLNKVTVVVLGQDPYPNGEGTGLAFGVSMASGKLPASLRIIKNEIETSKAPQFFKKHEDYSFRTLEHWWYQGVCLLNTALTVQAGIAGSHVMQWQWFTKEVVRIISEQTPCVWLLWGAKAKGFRSFINHQVTEQFDNLVGWPTDKNYILEADHPAAETYPNSKYKFTGCGHFNTCNEILVAKNQKIINW